MLSIDDLKKLADMQEKLLMISSNDRGVNLEKYKDIAMQIDEYYFSSLLSEIKSLEHNQTLEEELEFLEQISSSYEQVLVEQLKFRNVCELYGDTSLELSDISVIDKEYIDSRKNAISGYLISKKNIENTKKELDLLSGKLRDEEIKNNDLKKRLLEYEEVLRNNFVNAEGRYLNGIELEYVSVLSEYKKLGYDFKELLYDSDKIKEILRDVYDEMKDSNEKLKAAELCYDRIPNVDSKTVLDEITLENTKVKYKLTMVKILELLCSDIDNYDMFLEKRRDLFDLIRYRLDYIKKLGVSVSIDPFGRTKVFEQIKVVEVISDNSKNIYKIRKSISELNGRLEEMISIRDSEKEEINNIRDIIIERIDTDVIVDEEVSMNDIVSDNVIDELSKDVKNDEKIVFESIKETVDILDNQVISIRDSNDKLKMDIISQKTGQVIKRVNEMVNNVPVIRDTISEDVVPELIIEQVDVNDDTLLEDIDLVKYVDIDDALQKEIDDSFCLDNDNKDINDESNDMVDSREQEITLTDVSEVISEHIVDKVDDEEDLSTMFSFPENVDVRQIDTKEEDNVSGVEDSVVDVINIDESLSDSDIFMSVDPFLETPLFTDRTDDIDFEVDGVTSNNVSDNNDTSQSVDLLVDSFESDKDLSLPELDGQEVVSDEMPDAFWVVQDDYKSINNNSEKFGLSFDEQVELLTDNNYKKRQLI